MASRVCIIGLDCVPPELLFDQWLDQMPNVRALVQRGVYGALESTIPPITVPAWMCMMTGQDPGALGIYGFRNRLDRSYDALAFANGRMVRQPALWDLLAQSGLKTIALGVPLTYPPRAINGVMVTDFLAPDTSSDYTYPPELKEEIREAVGEYILDTRGFRTDDRDRLLADIYRMTERRFALARHLMAAKPWDLFVMVEIGPDRMHHAFWRYLDRGHRLHEPGHRFENAIRDYYVTLDTHIGTILDQLDDDTAVLLVSDHGAKRMDGAICFNEWLMREGYLVLKERPASPTPLTPAMVDWPRTAAWGNGGYYGRLFLNVRGREPEGALAPDQVDAVRSEISAKLRQLGDEAGKPIGTRVFRPEEIYRRCERIAPDLIVYFGDLSWRSAGSVGHSSVWTRENDTGPDDANHAQHGVFLLANGKAADDAKENSAATAGRREARSIYDIAPTVLSLFGIKPPAAMSGQAFGRASVDSISAYSPEEEAELARRLEDLGYL